MLLHGGPEAYFKEYTNAEKVALVRKLKSANLPSVLVSAKKHGLLQLTLRE